MRFVNLYLVGYIVFVLGVVLALWRADLLTRIDPIWIGTGLLAAIGLGIMFAGTAGKPALTEERD